MSLNPISMNETSLNRSRSIYAELMNHLAERPREITQSLKVIAGMLLVLLSGEIIFSLQTGSILDVLIVAALLLLHIGYDFLAVPRKGHAFLPQILYFITCILICWSYINKGTFDGSYFYLFPAALAYFSNTTKHPSRNRFQHFFIIIGLFFSALLLNQLLPGRQVETDKISLLWIFRFGVSAILSGLMLRHLFYLQSYGVGLPVIKRNYYDALFQSNQDAFIIYNQENHEVVDCNKRLLTMLEWPENEPVIGMDISRIMMRYLSGESPNLDTIMNGLPDNWYGEADFKTQKKQLLHAFIKNVQFNREDTGYCILTIRDITEMKMAETELRKFRQQVEKAASAKARFLSSMSHELRTPLNGIIGTSNIMLSEPDLTDNVKKHINVLKYSSEHMLGIINDILDFSKIDAGKMELKKQAFNLRECMDNLVASFENQFKAKGIALITQYDGNLDKVFILSDKVKLGQVIANLLSNALKFTLAGRVELHISIVKSTSRKITVSFSVRDTGIGIAKDKQMDIFQGFTQVHAENLKRDFGGTGLGLSISEKLVSMFGGELQVDSELGRGSNFYFTMCFPVADAIVKKELANSMAEQAADIRGIRVLIVEDNEINANILKNFLHKWEVNVKEATHGIQALELLKYHTFDLVMMDLEMPEMDGYTTIRKIRETNSELPVIAFTAALLENMDSFIADNGFNDYILKPYRPSDLKMKMAKYAPHRKVDY